MRANKYRDYQPLSQCLTLLIVAMLMVLLAACGDVNSTPLSQAGTAVANGVEQGRTAGATGLTKAPTVVSQANTAVAGGVVTAGTAIADFLTPGPTPTPTSTSLPVYPGAQPLDLSDSQLDGVLTGQGLNAWKNYAGQPAINFYRVSGVSDRDKVVKFYKEGLTGQGWTDQTEQLGRLTNQANISFFGQIPSLYTKSDQVLFTGISTPVTADVINTLGLGPKLNAGDILIMTMQGAAKLNL